MSLIVEKDVTAIIGQVDCHPLKGKKILLTGSNGLFGRYIASVVSALNKKNNYKTTLYCLSLHGPNDDIGQLATHDKLIIPRAIDLSKTFEFSHKVDYILHAACYAQPQKFIENKFETIELNVNTTRLLLEIAKKNKAKFLFFSSAEVYGDIPKDLIPVPESYNGNIATSGIRSIYGESKRLGETICSMFRRDEGVDAFIARISHVYGPGISTTDKRVLGEFIRKAFEEKKITLMDQGRAIKTWGYISDIVSMLLNVVIHGSELIYNVGGVDSVSIKDMALEVGRQTGAVVVIPTLNANKQHIATDPQVVKLDLSKYSQEFGRPKFVSFTEGIQRTLAWNREVKKVVAHSTGRP